MGAKPSKHKDMAICLVLFNPAQTKRMLMNYFFCRNEFVKQGLPVFTMELVYEGREPEIPDAFHVHASSVMFHKENLYRLLEKRIPKQYKKLAFLDCDIVFADPSWYKHTSELLEDHDIVQPFEVAHWMDLTYTTSYLSRKTVLLNKTKQWSFDYHPGFAWCMTRKWYKQVGFFDYAISGSGDTLSSAAWLKKVFPKKFQSLPKPLEAAYADFCAHEKPGVAYLKGMQLYHLYHGSRKNRQYSERHALLNTKTPITELVKPNKEGVYEWAKDADEWNAKFQEYFEHRNDDDVCEEVAVKVSVYG
jgi:hypothetical protein